MLRNNNGNSKAISYDRHLVSNHILQRVVRFMSYSFNKIMGFRRKLIILEAASNEFIKNLIECINKM